MNRICSTPVEVAPAPVEKRTFRSRSYENGSVRDRIKSMNTQCSTNSREAVALPEKRVLRSWNSEHHSRGRAYDAPGRSMSVNGHIKVPMKLPGLITDKGGEDVDIIK